MELMETVSDVHRGDRYHFLRSMKVKNIDITLKMLEVLRLLWNEDKMNQQDMVNKTQRNKASITSLLDNMSRRGLVVRTPLLADKRNKLISLTMDQLFGMMAMLIVLRSFLATAIGTAILSWTGYQSQWQSINDISVYADAADALNKTGYQRFALNGMMDSAKIILGILCWFVIPVLFIEATHSYGTFNSRRIVFFRKAIRGNSIKGYNFRNQ